MKITGNRKYKAEQEGWFFTLLFFLKTIETIETIFSLLAEVSETIGTIRFSFLCLLASKKKIVPIVSIVFKTSASKGRGRLQARSTSKEKKLSLLSLLSLNLRKQRPSSRSTLSLARARRGRSLLAEVLTTIEARRFLIFFFFPTKKEGKWLSCLIFIAFRARFCRQLFTFAATY